MKYQLHDYEIDSFILEKDSIILSFPNGFYAEDDNGNEIKPLRHKIKNHICPSDKCGFLEQGTGIEPAFTAWEAVVLPIYEPCINCMGIIAKRN